MIELRHVCVDYGPQRAVDDVSVLFPKGKVTVLAGPNGCGKTTLLKVAARLLAPSAGEALCGGRPLASFGRRAFARLVAVLPQGREAPNIPVEMLVEHGRFPYLGLSRKPSARDREIVREAMERAGIYALRRKSVAALSGGERQKAYIAMAIAQDTPVLLLDEPTTYLDIRHQFEILETVRALNAGGKTVAMVLHDLSQALQYADQLVLMEAGRLRAAAPADAVLHSGLLESVFGVRIQAVPGAGYCCAPGK